MNVPGCATSAMFSYHLSGSNGDRISLSSADCYTPNPPLTYSWRFSGSQSLTSTDANPVIQLSGSGIEGAGLVITDATGCVSYDTVNILYGPQGPFNMWGQVFYAGCNVTLYIIREDTVGYLNLIDSMTLTCTTSGYDTFNYSFNIPGTYYLKGACAIGNPGYANYLPSYSYAALSWTQAEAFYYDNYQNSSVDTKQVVMQQGINTGGPGFIGGWVSQGAGLVAHQQSNYEKNLDDPIAGVQIDLTTSSGHAVAYTYTDANGRYQFNNLPYGTHILFADELNKRPSPVTITLSAAQPADSSVDLSINSNSAVATGIYDINNVSLNAVFPDPVISSCTLNVSSHFQTAAILKVIDALGRTQLQKPAILQSGNNSLDLNLDELASGVYQLVLQTQNNSITYKIVKSR